MVVKARARGRRARMCFRETIFAVDKKWMGKYW
jgi:hypothetical protein